MQIDRKELLKEMKEEKLLRQQIRKIIGIVKERKFKTSQKSLQEEKYLRTVIRKLLTEATPDQDPAPSKSTGINVLEDLLKKIIPVLEADYKLLTTDIEQRKSFRAHIINAVKNTLAPIRATDAGEAGVPESPEAEMEDLFEEVDIDIEDEDKFIDIEDDKEEPEEEEISPQEEFGVGAEGNDLTGRNMAYQSYKKIESNIIDSYDLIANEEDKQLFYDYLVTNLKLYFDKFEDELTATMVEPTTPEYEEAKVEEPMPAEEEPAADL